ncbi:S8 family serine peptidase [Gordonia bronchialis]|uniref:S8 family serine peptidase n=1 Tax=Gordonia bronchialis TaxID=2054 RepID=UPI001CBD184D|nr:S8 family serine peptidase [Gordonia bronchialis]
MNRQVLKGEQSPFRGTSFAAAVVSGEVALVRSRFPHLSAGEVMDLIRRTSHTSGRGPDLATGYGLVDPLAALTSDVATTPGRTVLTTPVAGPAPANSHADRARTIALLVAGGSVFLIGAAWALFTRCDERGTRRPPTATSRTATPRTSTSACRQAGRGAVVADTTLELRA